MGSLKNNFIIKHGYLIPICGAIVVFIAILFVPIISLFGISPLKLSEVMPMFLVGLWNILPYLILALLMKRFSKYVAPTIGLLVVSTLIVLTGVWSLLDTIYIHADAQGDLTLILFPIFLLVGVSFAGLACICIRFLTKKSTD